MSRKTRYFLLSLKRRGLRTGSKMRLLLALLLLIPAEANAYYSFFDGKLLYENPIAFPRSPSIGIELETSRYLGDRIWDLEAALGAESPLITCKSSDISIQLGLEAGTWIMLGYKEGAFPLLMQDFAFSVPLALKWKNFSFAIKWNHISAHLGDGMETLLEEQLTTKEKEEYELYKKIANAFDMNLTLSEPFNYSRDFISGHIDTRNKVGIVETRAYVHGGWAYKIIPRLNRKHWGGSGLEIWYPGDYLVPYYAQDVTYNGDANSMDFSAELGVKILPKNNGYLHPRLAITAYIGSDRRGQLLGRRLKQLGFAIYF